MKLMRAAITVAALWVFMFLMQMFPQSSCQLAGERQRDDLAIDHVRRHRVQADEPIAIAEHYCGTGQAKVTHTLFDQVKAFIERLAPQPVCDDCITDRLGLPERDLASHNANQLVGTAGFERRLDACSLCSIEKQVVRRKA